MKNTTQRTKVRTNLHTELVLLSCVAGLLGLAGTSQADLLSTVANQGSTASSGWNMSIWRTNVGGTLTGALVGPPVAENTYSGISNGVAFGANTANTTIRNPYVSGQAPIQTFPGDSLRLTNDTQIRFKRIGSGNVPVCNFPGVGGNPGLILAGGLLNPGDDDNFPITGWIRVDKESYFALGGNSGQAPTATGRRFSVSAQITGSGNLVFFNGSNRVAQVFSGTNDAYSGQWIIKSAWVQANGTNSLGTNSSIIVDPLYTLPFTVTDTPGPADLELNYNINSAGKLVLTNGGRMRLHQDCVFTQVIIHNATDNGGVGVSLSPGVHYYRELRTLFPNTFPAGGSGTIAVQPYGPPPPIGAAITADPALQTVFPGGTARFMADGAGPAPVTFKWQKNGADLSDAGNISGATNTTLVITSVSAVDVAGYAMVVSNPYGAMTSSVAPLSLAALTGEAYEGAVLAANPSAFYQLNETTDPALGNALAFDYAGGHNATYGIAVQNGNGLYNVTGPGAPEFPGLMAGNKAARFAANTANSRVTVSSPWNLNTNTVTLTAWINPSAAGQLASAGVVFCRGGGTVAGLNFSPVVDTSGYFNLGYTWNNQPETYNWMSGLVPPAGQWSLVALVVTPTNATIHVMNTNGLVSSSRPLEHVIQPFGAGSTTLIGEDSGGNSTGNRAFNGDIDNVAVFTSALTKDQLVQMYYLASQNTNFAPMIALHPTNQTVYAGQTALLTVVGGGTDPLGYRWQTEAPPGSGVYADLSDGGQVSGSKTTALTISGVTDLNSGNYQVILTNAFGAVTSSVAFLSVAPTAPAENIVMAGVLQPGGSDWETGASWSDGNPASLSAVMKPGSTYALYPTNGFNARMRTPANQTVAVFPGDILTVTGNGIWTNNPGSNGASAEIRFKQPTAGTVQGTVIFKKLVLNGAQMDAGADAGNNVNTVIIGGEMNVSGNNTFYNDGSNDRGFRVDSWLRGSGSIEYHSISATSFRSNYVNNLNITGTSNTYSGTWNIVVGTLLGTGQNSLGTNDIVIGAEGAFETTYDVLNTNASLFLGGRMYLHQNDTFRSVFVNGVPLAVGSYTFAQLNALYPTNFPNSWMPQNGAESYTNGGSGSITVLVMPAPEITQQPVPVSKYPTETAQFTVGAQGNHPLYYQWRKGGINLTDTGHILGSGTTNLVITNIVPADFGNYDVVVTNSIGSVTSVVAVLTVLPTGQALNLALDYGGTPLRQPSGANWNTPNYWTDGNPASLSALSNPGSTYRVPAYARLRSPETTLYAAFPGVQLTLEGDGVWAEGGSDYIGEMRLKHETVYFKKLVMAGGQIDQGDDTVAVIQGQMDIQANAPLYVDNGAGHDRQLQIDAWLTGAGSIEWHQYGATFGYNLLITGTSNTFSGRWSIVQGCVLGAGPGSLGTNTITVSANGALETLYDINNPQGDLILDGQMFLHQNDRFHAVTVAGTPLAPGTYTFAQLNAAYPANFPASWPFQYGSTTSTASGSITVIGDAPPQVPIEWGFASGNLTLTWSQGMLLEAPQVTGPWTTNVTATSPFTVQPTEPQKYYRIQVQ